MDKLKIHKFFLKKIKNEIKINYNKYYDILYHFLSG